MNEFNEYKKNSNYNNKHTKVFWVHKEWLLIQLRKIKNSYVGIVWCPWSLEQMCRISKNKKRDEKSIAKFMNKTWEVI